MNAEDVFTEMYKRLTYVVRTYVRSAEADPRSQILDPDSERYAQKITSSVIQSEERFAPIPA